MPVNIRDYRESDAPALNTVALAAFAQFKEQYSDWPSMAAGVARMSDLASTGEIILADIDGRTAGGVANCFRAQPYKVDGASDLQQSEGFRAGHDESRDANSTRHNMRQSAHPGSQG
jgi:hypothetical protein